jgi:hypothetical protein
MGLFGIAAASGTFKGVFVHGVLSAFEECGIVAGAYGCASSSVISGTLAAIGKAREVGLDYWTSALAIAEANNQNMSIVALDSIRLYGPRIKEGLFIERKGRVLICVSAVNNDQAAALTQGSGAKSLGRRLMISALRGDSTWPDENLNKVIFDSEAASGDLTLTSNNFDEVSYASTRMLHAWDQPAWIDGAPFIDASYTCSCPVYEFCERGWPEVIAIGTEPGKMYTNIFRTKKVVPGLYGRTRVHVVLPDYDPRDVGVDLTMASVKGLETVYAHGYEKGLEFSRYFAAKNNL